MAASAAGCLHTAWTVFTTPSWVLPTPLPAPQQHLWLPTEMKCHLSEIRGLAEDQALQMCSGDIAVCTRKPQCQLMAHPLPQKPLTKFQIFFPTNFPAFVVIRRRGGNHLSKCELGCGMGSCFPGG